MQVLLIIALVIFCILMLPVDVCITYDNELTAKTKILFYSAPLLSDKKERKKLSKDEYVKNLKLLRRTKKSSKDLKKAEEKIDLKTCIAEDIPFYLELVKDFIVRSYPKFIKGLTIRINKLDVTVASDDAAKTAILYGTVSQSVAYFLNFLDEISKVKRKRNSKINVIADFTSEQAEFVLDISLRWRLIRAIIMKLALEWNLVLAIDAYNKRKIEKRLKQRRKK